MLDFVKNYTPEGKCPLAGNSVQFDKMFLTKYMPKFIGHLHYRVVDVSTVKELCRYKCTIVCNVSNVIGTCILIRRWYPKQFSFAPKKSQKHR